MAAARDPLGRLRTLCARLPGCVETVTFGHPTFQAAGRTFAVLEEYDGAPCLVFKAEKSRQRELVRDPRFFTAPYVGRHGWTGARLAGRLDWRELGALLLESYRLVAPRRLVNRLLEGRT